MPTRQTLNTNWAKKRRGDALKVYPGNPDALTEPVRALAGFLNGRYWNHDQVKSMTYIFNTHHSLSRSSALIGYGKPPTTNVEWEPRGC